MALLLGKDGYAALTVNQADRMTDGLIETAEQVIDAYTGQSWLAGGTVTAERHEIANGRVWLKHRPVTAVTAVRLGSAFYATSLLTLSSDYVVDLPRGLITFRAYTRITTWSSSLTEVEVDYTVPQTVPADVSEAAGLLVLSWLKGQSVAAGTNAAGIYKSWSTDGQSFEYRDNPEVGELSEPIMKLLSRHCRPVLA